MKRFLAVLAVLLALVAALWFVPSDHYLLLPEPAQPVDPLVKVPAERGGEEDGGIYYLVAIVRKASIVERLFPGLYDGASLVPSEAINPFGVSEGERREESRNEMSLSQQIAIAVALRELGHDVDVRYTGVTAALVLPDTPAEGTVELGDRIVEIDDQEVARVRDLRRLMRRVRPGERVRLTVVRDGERRQLALPTEADPDDATRAVIGVIPEQAADIDLPVEVRIEAGDIGGPSAGLAFALDVVDELGREVDDGRRVAVTGALDLEGNVLAIGGVKQKTIGAREAGADILVVPRENEAEARRYAEGVDVVAVESFEQALATLTTG